MKTYCINKNHNLVTTGHLEGNDQSGHRSVINPSIINKGSSDLFRSALFLCLLIYPIFSRLKMRVMSTCYENIKVSQKTIRPSFQGLNCKAEMPHIPPGKGRLPGLDKQSSDKCMYFG